MVVRVEKTAQGFVIPITPEMAKSLELAEGSEVELQPVKTASGVRYATAEESIKAFERTLPQHENTYRALAK